MEYPKITTVFRREQDHFVGQTLACEEFGVIHDWVITEKLDGTNMRVIFEREKPHVPMTCKPLDIRGRTDNANLPQHVMDIFKHPVFDATRWDSLMGMGMQKMIIYGEACGPKIQSGGNYADTDGKARFIPFDVWIDGWWLEYDRAQHICRNLGMTFAPLLSVRTIEEAASLVQRRLPSNVGANPGTMEGVVATSKPLMLFRNGLPIKWKLKCRDYPR